MKSTTFAPLGALVLILIAGCTGPAGNQAPGKAAPAFTLTDTQGRTVQLSDYAATPVVLFFASVTGCAPCEVEQRKVLAPLALEANGSLAFLTVAQSYERNSDLEQFKRGTGANWPHARDTDRVAQRYDVLYVSTVVALDANHTIVLHDVDPATSAIKGALGL